VDGGQHGVMKEMRRRLRAQGGVQAAGLLGVPNELDHEVDLRFEGSLQIFRPGLEKTVAVGRECA